MRSGFRPSTDGSRDRQVRSRPLASSGLDGQDGREVAHSWDRPGETLDAETPARIRQDSAPQWNPEPGDTNVLESAEPAESSDLAPRDEVMRGPVPLVRLEVGTAIVSEKGPAQSRGSAGIVMRLDQEESAARAHHGPESRENLLAPMEMVQALENQRRVDRGVPDVSPQIQRRGADDLNVAQPIGGASI